MSFIDNRPEHFAGELCPSFRSHDKRRQEWIGTLVARKSKFGPFLGCSRYPDCKFTCQQSTFEIKNDRRGSRLAIPRLQFIPIAEETGLILPIGAWVFDEACSQARTWSGVGMPAKTMAVNVSGVQFQSEDFLDGLFAALNKTGLEPSILELHVNESVPMRDPERTAFVLKALRDKGVHPAVDNFGTGNSSLSSMQELCVDALKIDRLVLRKITAVPGGTAAVEAFIDMGRGLHLRINAQGVEMAEDLEFLWAHDCDEAQGNFFGRLVPPDQLAKLCRRNRVCAT
jgi:diguanylate cyclase